MEERALHERDVELAQRAEARRAERELIRRRAESEGLAISKDALHALSMKGFAGPIHLIHRDAEVPAAASALARETLLGFDTETKPVFQKGVSHPPALIQLAGAEAVYIFQLRALRHLGPLLDVLGNPAIVKSGVALADDVRKLREQYRFEPAGFVDVGELARRRGYQQTGLRALAGLLLGFRISKSEQRSNWARLELTRNQLAYAATDAWVSRELYSELQRIDEPVSVEPPVASGP